MSHALKRFAEKGRHMLPAVSWILIANRSSAKLFVRDEHELVRCLRAFEHPEGRLRDGEVNADKSGRAFPRLGQSFSRVASSSLDKPHAPHEHDAEVFASELADLINEGAHQGHFDRLFLIAEPRFLGHLRRALSEHAASRVVASQPRDIAGRDEASLIDDVARLLEANATTEDQRA